MKYALANPVLCPAVPAAAPSVLARLTLVVSIALTCCPARAGAQEAAGTVKSVRGQTQIERGGQRQAVRVGDAVQASDRMLTGADGYASIGFRDQSSLAIGPHSQVELRQYRFNPTTHQGEQQVRVRSGSLAAISGQIAKASPEAVQFNAGTVTLGVRGTRFVIEAQSEPPPDAAPLWRDGSGQVLRSSNGLCWQSAGSRQNVRSDCNPDHFVLLPDTNGRVGRIVLQSGTRTLSLSSAYASAQAGDGTLQAVTLTEAEARQRYQGLLDALPPAPRQFVVRFAVGSATQLSAESAAVIEQVRAAVAQWPVLASLTVVGHTDTAGDALRNDALSLERARTVGQLLQGLGVAAAHLQIAGRGERELLVPTSDNTPEAQNRRVEITLH